MINRHGRLAAAVTALTAALVLAACGSVAGTPLPLPTRGLPVPTVSSGKPAQFDHIVVVIFENKGVEQVIGGGHAPTFDALAAQGVLFTRSYAITHPSQPNYLALFSGGTHGITNDSCPHTFTGPNLARQLADAGFAFTGYSEGLPSPGYQGCSADGYARKHAPWVNFSGLPDSTAQPFSAFPTDYRQLPQVSFVVPDLCNDMHNCSIATGDRWLADHMRSYADWARAHRSLLIVTFDEDDTQGANIISTIVVGQGITPRHDPMVIDHYTVLRTIEDCFGLSALGFAGARTPMTGVCH